jgi:hypothetical protein
LKESDLTEADLEFSQGVFLEAIDASYAMGYTQIMFETLSEKYPQFHRHRKHDQDVREKGRETLV